MLRSFGGHAPTIEPTAWVDDSAQVIGRVTLGAQASVWCGAVLRADINLIGVGARSNVQDLSVLHVTADHPVAIAEDVTIGHRVVVHGAAIGRGCLIGIGAIVLDGAVIGEDCLVAAGAVVTPASKIPPGSLVMGIPARVVRPLSASERAQLGGPARNYLTTLEQYRAESRA